MHKFTYTLSKQIHMDTDCTSMHTEHSHTALAASSHPLLQLSRMEEHQ